MNPDLAEITDCAEATKLDAPAITAAPKAKRTRVFIELSQLDLPPIFGACQSGVAAHVVTFDSHSERRIPPGNLWGVRELSFERLGTAACPRRRQGGNECQFLCRICGLRSGSCASRRLSRWSPYWRSRLGSAPTPPSSAW